MQQVFGLTTRGLESVCAAEMEEIHGVVVENTGYRRVEAHCADPARLLGLRTVDDIFLFLAYWDGLPAQRSGLEWIKQRCETLDVEAGGAVIAALRGLRRISSFSLTVNFVGQRNYSADEVKKAAAGAMEARFGWRYGGEDESELNLRIFIVHAQAWVGLRLSQRSLHSRAYKQTHLVGSLKPTVAAAMLRLLEPWPGGLLLDPFCGAGTIPIEAGGLGLSAMGGDIDPAALDAARANLAVSGVTGEISRMDARALPLARRSVDFVAANLPWGRQVQTDVPLQALYQQACGEIERVLIPQGRATLLTSLPELVIFERLKLHRSIEISLFGQTPRILIYGR